MILEKKLICVVLIGVGISIESGCWVIGEN